MRQSWQEAQHAPTDGSGVRPLHMQIITACTCVRRHLQLASTTHNIYIPSGAVRLENVVCQPPQPSMQAHIDDMPHSIIIVDLSYVCRHVGTRCSGFGSWSGSSCCCQGLSREDWVPPCGDCQAQGIVSCYFSWSFGFTNSVTKLLISLGCSFRPHGCWQMRFVAHAEAGCRRK